jgi:hypothetical protein
VVGWPRKTGAAKKGNWNLKMGMPHKYHYIIDIIGASAINFFLSMLM